MAPLIPETVMDAPTQRLYFLSFCALVQALKLFDFFSTLLSPEPWYYLPKWVVLDLLLLGSLYNLRIPRLQLQVQGWASILGVLGALDVLLFGNYTIGIFGPTGFVQGTLTALWAVVGGGGVHPLTGRSSWVGLWRDKHLIGQHTVRLSPITTAKLNPYLESFCLSGPNSDVLIPVLFNNTTPSSIRYSLSPLNDPTAKTFMDVHSRELKSLLARRAKSGGGFHQDNEEESPDETFEREFGEYDRPSSKKQIQDSSTGSGASGSGPYPSLQKTQSLWYIRVNKPSVVRLEGAGGRGSGDAVRIRSVETTVVHCPSVRFTGEPKDTGDTVVRCTGGEEQLSLKVFGVPPLSLQWQREAGGKREQFLVEGIDGDTPQSGLVARELTIPLALTLNALGPHRYSLNSVADAVGNNLDLSALPQSDTTRTINVLSASAFSFRSCQQSKSVNLLQGKSAILTIEANKFAKEDAPWTITVKYTPAPPASASSGVVVGTSWTKEFIAYDKTFHLKADAPGEYTILSVQGQYCAGDVMSPETCKVVEVPRPRAEIEWRKLHECTGDVGVSASLILHGTPPYTVYYETRHNKGKASQYSKLFAGSRGELTLQPEFSGSFVYAFTSLDDANYKGVPLNGPVIKQTVHPLATASLVWPSGQRRAVKSCSGDTVEIPIQLAGNPPWNLEYQVVSPQGSETVLISGIKSDRDVLKVKIPKEINADGGTFQVDLVSVQDTTGCKRTLSNAGVSVNVQRVKPTVRFYSRNGQRSVTILEGDDAKLPLRLTGNAPWILKYRHEDHPERTHRIKVNSPNDAVFVKDRGLYTLIEVEDAQCPGTILVPEHTYQVDWVPRPAARLSSTSRAPQATNGSYIRPPVCEGTEDSIDIELKGRPPFQVKYLIGRNDENKVEKQSFNSLQSVYHLGLRTSQPGRYYYRIAAVGDLSYPLNNEHQDVQPGTKPLQFEQQILARPAAWFKNSNRLSYCLNDDFRPRSESYLSNDGLLVLLGRAPFVVRFSIKNMASSEVHKELRELHTNEWNLDFPNYTFKTVGPHQVTIDSVHDASSCDEQILDPLRRTLWVDVAETAMIVPYERRQDVCVGELLQFQLEGTPPWQITYKFDDTLRTTIQKVAKYTTVADAAGIFQVVSIAHQQAQCQTTVSDMRLTVHEIPSAKVHHGDRFEENIKEGEQAEIVFTLVGEPPFTFTYQRVELDKYVSRGKKPKVLETHTVSGITTSEYSIFSSAEGTWTVTFIADKWCRYPPAHVDPSIEKV